jgi:hypothetical protein
MKKLIVIIAMFLSVSAMAQREFIEVDSITLEDATLAAINEGFEIRTANDYSVTTMPMQVRCPKPTTLWLVITKTDSGVRIKTFYTSSGFLFVSQENGKAVIGRLWNYLVYFTNKLNVPQ